MFKPGCFPSALIILLLLVPLAVCARPDTPPACSGAAVALAPNYRYAIGSAGFQDADGDAESGSTYRWIVDGTPLTTTAVAEGLLLHFESSPNGANGETPLSSVSLAYAPGRWGQALALPDGGELEFAPADNLDLAEGTVELWVALRAEGSDPIYSSQSHILFFYQSAGDDYMLVGQSKDSGIIYAGGTVDGEWESAYGSRGNMRGWHAGGWHHLAFTYSEAENYMRFYVDGVLTADTNEDHYWPPAAGGSAFSIGGSSWWGNTAYYLVDEVRLSGHAATTEEIAARARRDTAPAANEIWLPTDQLTPGDTLVFEFTPRAGGENGSPCQSSPLEYPGLPIVNPRPPSTLLPAGTTSFTLTIDTITPTLCAYSVGEPLPYAEMTPFGESALTITHQAAVTGLVTDSNTLNDVYVRCADHDDFLMQLQYRVLSTVNPSFPRTGNLWGWWEWKDHGHDLASMARVDLWLGADSATADEIRQLRGLNPGVRVLTSINAVENNDIPTSDYYLKDVNGDLIEVWPGSYRLNLTRPEVAEYQANYAYRSWLDSGLMADGVFIDNVMTTQSWLTHDIYGNPVQIDANEDGLPDDPDQLDAAWKTGVFHEIDTFRRLMPYAVVSSHSTDIYEPGIAERFNGNSLGFRTADVLEGEMSFAELWDLYNAWMTRARPPVAVMFESSPLDDIAYGYDYEPLDKIPTSTLEFARSYYPWMRFGLALTLMDDGYFAHEYGDTWHGNDWWYDELDYDLGYPLGSARRVDMGFDPGPNLIVNASFEDPIDLPWDFWADPDQGCVADVSRDTTTAAEGDASARIIVTATSGVDWHVDFDQRDRSLEKDVVYDLTFWAKSDRPRSLTLSSQKGSEDWRNYGLWAEVELDTSWQPYTVTFEANETASDARLQFLSGAVTGTVWIDGVRLVRHPPDVFRRDFDHGIVLLNGTSEPQTVTLGPGYWRLQGEQAPRYEAILDDSGAGFTLAAGDWLTRTYDSGEWTALGPFYHDWGDSLRELAGGTGEARWELPIAAADTYTVSAWWPAAPAAITWTQSARFEIIAADQVVASATLSQRDGGDEWQQIALVRLDPQDRPYVRLLCTDGLPCVADALYIRSHARYNDGAAALEVTLAPLDGVVLRKVEGWYGFLPLVER